MDVLAHDAHGPGLKKFEDAAKTESSPLSFSGGADGDSQRTELEKDWSTIGDISVMRISKKRGKCHIKNAMIGSEVPPDDVVNLLDDGEDRPQNGGMSGLSRDGSCSSEVGRNHCSGSSYYVLPVDEVEDGDNVCDTVNCADSPRPETDVFNTDACDLSSLEAGSSAGKRNRQISTDSSGSAANEAASTAKANKKAKKKSRQRTQDEDEIDRILADLAASDSQQVFTNSKVSSEDQQQSAAANSAAEDQSKKKKKSKKRSGRRVNLPDLNGDCQPSSDGHSPEVLDVGNSSKVFSLVTSGNAVEGSPTEDSAAAGVDAKTECSGDSKRDRKKPSKRQLEAIHEALRKAKEEEERCQQEQIARQKKLEEAERFRLESLRLEQERKEKKKQKSKDKRERLRAEGKLLSKSQKMARAKVEAALSAWREHGIDVPQVGGKRAESRVNLPKSDASRNKTAMTTTESDAEPYSLMSASSISTDTEDHFCWEGAASASSDIEAVVAPLTTLSAAERKQRHLSDPVQDQGTRGTSMLLPTKRVLDGDSSCDTEDGFRLRTQSAVELRSASAKTSSVEGRTRLRKLSESGKLVMPSGSLLRSPVVCVLGHVDTGKTKILDKIRRTHVQDGEAGGITQQIGATMIPADAIREKCCMAKSFPEFILEIPGLLVIDTPGHESFRNLRSRGSSLCDIAVLVVDIMHGLEQQTLESIALLKQRKTPFVVALNKIDRLYGWKSSENEDVEEVVKRQITTTTMEFEKKCNQIIAEFAEQGLNASLFYQNRDPRTYISMVPVSAITGDGMGNLLATVAQLCQTMMYKRLTFSEELKATVLEVKTIAGLGTTIDVILVNGHLKESDTIIVAGQDGPIVTQIRSILMPQPLRELRVKNPYQEYKVVRGAQGVKLSGKDLDKAVAGLPLFVSGRTDSVPDLKEKMMRLFRSTISSIKLSERGVYVQASTLGSLEALLDYLKTSGIPYAGVKVGPVVKKDVIKASVMLEHDVLYAVILAFDVKVEREAQETADHLGIKVFQADIIYHLFDRYVQYRDDLAEKKKNYLKKYYVLPCKLSVVPDCVLSVRDPIVIGVRVLAGILRVGTPLCVPSKKSIDLGTVASICVGNQSLDIAKEGDEVCIKIEPVADQSPKTYGKHFDLEDQLVSKISRQTIDVCKEYYREDLRKSDWQLMVELKKLLLIV